MLRSPAWSLVWSLLRLAAAAAIAAAIIAQLVKSVTGAVEAGRDVTTIVTNFFSFFTILSNAATAVVLVLAAVWYLSRRRAAPLEGTVEPRGLAFLLAAVTTYMVITGIVYNTLLRGIPLEPGSIVPWSNEILHLVAPLFLLADLLVGPFRRALPWRTVLGIVVFPLVWVGYTLLRAPFIVNPGNGDPYWYPYPFLNPYGSGGWGSVIVYVIGIAVAIIVVAAFVVWVGRRRGVAIAKETAAVAQ